MPGDMGRRIAACASCLLDKGPMKVSMARTDHVSVPFDTAQVDLQGPFSPPSEQGWRFVLTVLGVFTRCVFLRGTKSKEKREVATVLLDVFWGAGSFPRVLMTDRGTGFLKCLMMEVLAVLRVSKYTSPAYTPRIVGMVERSHRTMAGMLRVMVCDGANFCCVSSTI